MLVDLVVRNGKLASSDGNVSGGVAVDNGKIVAVAKETNLPKGDKTIDAKGNYIMPGLVDHHVHFGVYQSFEKDVQTETIACAGGGVTTVMCMGKLSRMGKSLQDETATYHKAFPIADRILAENLMVDFGYHWMIATDRHASEIPEYATRYGVTSYKFYLGYRTGRPESGIPSFDDGVVYSGFEAVGRMGGVALVHAENQEIARVLENQLKKKGQKDLAAWEKRSPGWLEGQHIRAYAPISKAADCTLYFVHITSTEGLDEVRYARADGARIAAETTPHYLTLTKRDDPPGLLGKVMPPLRDKEDLSKLWQALESGTIDTVGSDHINNINRLREQDDKVDDVWKTTSGFPGTETMLPVLLSEGVNKGRLSLKRLVDVCCRNPALIFGLCPRKGTLDIGSDADIVIVDLNKTMKVTADKLHSSSQFSPFEGRCLKGWPVITILRGHVIMEEGQVMSKARMGQYIPRKPRQQLPPV